MNMREKQILASVIDIQKECWRGGGIITTHFSKIIEEQAPVVQPMDSSIRRINHYLVDK